MRLPPGLLLLALPVLLALPGKVMEQDEQEQLVQEERLEDQGSARIFPLLPPYANVDFGANFNKLKSSGDAAYFVVRDSTVFIAVNLMWGVVHYLIWDGKVSNTQDIIDSILSPGVDVQLSKADDTSRFGIDSLGELSATKLWNFFTDPNPSTRNLYLNIGFGLAGHILWILPTYLGIIPEAQARQDERLDRQDERLESSLPGIPSNIAGADPVALWNRLLSPQGVVQMMAINTLNYMGKLLFWTFMSSVPDVATTGTVGRAHSTIRSSLPRRSGARGKSGSQEDSWITQVLAKVKDNVQEAVWRLQMSS